MFKIMKFGDMLEIKFCIKFHQKHSQIAATEFYVNINHFKLFVKLPVIILLIKPAIFTKNLLNLSAYLQFNASLIIATPC